MYFIAFQRREEIEKDSWIDGKMPELESFIQLTLEKLIFPFPLSQEISHLFRNQIRSLQFGDAHIFLIN